MRQPHQTCETCQHWHDMPTPPGRLPVHGVEPGQCRINPPVALVYGDYPRTVWPRTIREDWCSQWAPK